MAANSEKKEKWEADINKSVSQYNIWFLKFAPATYECTAPGFLDTSLHYAASFRACSRRA